ncbi:MAG: hypothetical protein Fur005_08420 [Roseiflexaceae bacterium]
MNQQEISNFLEELGHVKVLIASEAAGSPEVAWGDSFYYVINAAGESPKMPFATVVINDYPGFDEASQLNRGGLIRLNIDLGRSQFQQLFGYPPAEHQAHQDEYDYTALNVLFPHPVYAGYGWAAIINPAGVAAEQAKQLLIAAYHRARRKVE